MMIDSVVVGAFQVNCWLAWTDSRQAIVVDPGADADVLLEFLRQKKLSVAAYLLSHGHVDHVCALAQLHRAMPAPIAMHSLDLKWAFSQRTAMPPYYPQPERPPEIARLLHDGSTFTDGGMSWTVIETPGHSPGCVCFHFPAERVLLSGDTLFSASVGRTDLEGGDPSKLADSLRALAQLPDDTTVYPGHGPTTTIGHEKRLNVYMPRNGRASND